MVSTDNYATLFVCIIDAFWYKQVRNTVTVSVSKGQVTAQSTVYRAQLQSSAWKQHCLYLSIKKRHSHFSLKLIHKSFSSLVG